MRMREILFRGKRCDNGEWVQGDLVHSQYKLGDTCVGQYGNTVGIHQVYPETAGQFTGLIDKNGKNIFEGDIIQHGKRKGTIFYYGNFGMFMIAWIPIGGANIFMNVLHTEVEVIGNIHDNPELVGGAEDESHS